MSNGAVLCIGIVVVVVVVVEGVDKKAAGI